MISSNDFRPGVTIKFRNGVWQIVESMHIKPGKGSAFVQTKLKNVETGDVLRVNFRAGERLPQANIEKLDLIFFYRDSGRYILIDAAGSESIELEAANFGQNLDLLLEGLAGITVLRHDTNILRVELPGTVDLLVQETPPGEKGDTTSGGGKPAILETGARITVPFHVKTGDKVRIDTTERKYLSRVNQ